MQISKSSVELVIIWLNLGVSYHYGTPLGQDTKTPHDHCLCQKVLSLIMCSDVLRVAVRRLQGCFSHTELFHAWYIQFVADEIKTTNVKWFAE